MSDTSSYIKHVYWLTSPEEGRLRERLASEGISLKSAKGIVCAPLDPLNRVTSVAPEVWNETCARQGSWYRYSDRNGLYLVVSAFELKGLEDARAAVITESEFVPPRRAGEADRKALLADPEVSARMPEEWKTPGETERRIHLRWARRMGSGVEDYDDLHRFHTANHANFIRPRLFVRKGGDVVPFSIDRTAHLCSCCLELFQVLGADYDEKLVAPCPGAVIFARLQKDRYLRVRNA